MSDDDLYGDAELEQDPEKYMVNVPERNRGRRKILTQEQMDRSILPHLEERDGCLIWTGFVHKRGYGFALHLKVHIAYWEFYNGPVPDGLELAHSCNVKLCVRHVRPKTHAENIAEYT